MKAISRNLSMKQNFPTIKQQMNSVQLQKLIVKKLHSLDDPAACNRQQETILHMLKHTDKENPEEYYGQSSHP